MFHVHMCILITDKKSLETTETTGHGTTSTAPPTTGHTTPTTSTSGRNTPSVASGRNTPSTTPVTTASTSTSSHGGANRRKGKPCVVLFNNESIS